MKLWIDDIRPMPDSFDIWVKNADEAIKILKSGVVTHVSFDHDLGDIKETDGPIVLWNEYEKTGYDIATWVERQAYLGVIPPFTYEVHSANPVGAERIKRSMQNAIKYWRTNENMSKR